MERNVWLKSTVRRREDTERNALSMQDDATLVVTV